MDLIKIDDNIRTLEDKRTKWMVSKESINFITKYISNHIQNPIVLEIGTNVGYSTLHLSKVAKAVLTLEKDEKFYKQSLINLKPATNVRIFNGDVLKLIPSIKQSGIYFNAVFIDAVKKDYDLYLESVIPLLQDKFVIFLDNTISHRDKMTNLLEYLNLSELDWQEIDIGDGMIIIKSWISYFFVNSDKMFSTLYNYI